MAQTNGYSIVNVQDVVQLIQDISNFKVKIYNARRNVQISVLNPSTGLPLALSADYLMTVVDYEFSDLTQYLILGNIIPGTTKPPNIPLPENVFLSVGAGTPVVLISAVQQVNAIQVPIVLLDTNPYLYFKSVPYLLTFYVADIDRLVEHKASILNLFTFPSKTFVLWDHFVIHNILYNGVYQPVFYAILNESKHTLECKVMFDWCGGVLVGRVDHQVIWTMSNNEFFLTNYYPFLSNTNNVQNQLTSIVGGSTNYIKQHNINPYFPSVQTFVDNITIANKLDYQAKLIGPVNQINTVYVPFVVPIDINDPVATSVVFPGSAATSMKWIGIAGVNEFLGDMYYAVFQTTQYANIQSTIIQNSIIIETTDEPDVQMIEKEITVGSITISFAYEILENCSTSEDFPCMILYREECEDFNFIEILKAPVSIDNLIKIPFYTSERTASQNYYTKPYIEMPVGQNNPTNIQDSKDRKGLPHTFG